MYVCDRYVEGSPLAIGVAGLKNVGESSMTSVQLTSVAV